MSSAEAFVAEAIVVEPLIGGLGTFRRSAIWLQRLIDSHPMRAFLALTGLYAAAVVLLSHFKLLWLDELITLHIARLAGPAAIWSALVQGADPNPPLTHILVHLCRALFGERKLALRLPAVAGYWIGLLSLFLYLLRRLPGTYALGGTLLSMCMATFAYSYESRSYGIFYGFAMLAFYLWSGTTDPERTASQRRNSLIGMALALAAGISTNYFAVLAFLPIAGGELTRILNRLRRQRRSFGSTESAFDLRIWVALVFAATPLLVYRPLIAHSIAQFAPYAWNKVSMDQVFDSYTEMVDVVLYPILALFVIAIVINLLNLSFANVCNVCRSGIRPAWFGSLLTRRPSVWPVPLHESVGIFCLMAYPFLGYVVASIRGGMLSPRFVVPVGLGFSIAAALVAFQLFGRVARSGLYFLLLFLVWFVCQSTAMASSYSEQKKSFYNILAQLPKAMDSVPSNAPIVIADPLFALTFQHYAPARLTRHVVFPVDFPAIRLYRHDDSPEENLWAGRNSIYSLPIVPLATLQQNAGPYLIIASDGNWLLRDLSEHRYTFTRLPIETRAGDIGGFTPLFRGDPSFYVGAGGLNDYFAYAQEVTPFRAEDNLPDAKPNAKSASDPGRRRELEH